MTITLADVDKNKYPYECWINIYNPYWWLCNRPLSDQLKHSSREASVKAAALWAQFFEPFKPAYRIHVKLKPVPKYE